jgi:hypothetical protein
VPNPTGDLLPGAYANVHFLVSLDAAPLVDPASTILFQADGPQVEIFQSVTRSSFEK